MNSSMNNAFYRMQTIICLLNNTLADDDDENDGRTINELSSLLNVNVKTIRNDFLNLKGNINFFPIDIPEELEDLEDIYFDEESDEFKDALKNGEYDDIKFILDIPTDKIASLFLTESELTALSTFIDSIKEERKNDSLGAEPLCMVKNNSRFYSTEDIKKRRIIEDAIRKGKNLEIKYTSPILGKKLETFVTSPASENPIRHDLDKNAIFFVDSRNFLFRFDRILEVKLTDKEVLSSDVSAPIDWEHAWGVTLGEKPTHVKVKIAKAAGVESRVKRDLGEKVKYLKDYNDEYLVYEEDLVGISAFRSWINSYGSSMVVMEPASLREEILQSIRERLEHYNSIAE